MQAARAMVLWTKVATAKRFPTAAPVPVMVAVLNKPPAPTHNVAVTFSPLHLFLPVIEGMGEAKITPKFSAAAIFGYGSIALRSPFQDKRLQALEAGAQVLFYPVGDFENGMQLGVEALYATVSGEVGTLTNTSDVIVQANGQALGVGGLIGYKYIAPIGFTLNLQGGGWASNQRSHPFEPQSQKVLTLPPVRLEQGCAVEQPGSSSGS
jgi:hypothetical protein